MTFTGSTTSGSATITSVPSTSGVVVGMLVTGDGIVAGTYVLSLVTNTSVTLTTNATVTSTAAVTFTAILQVNKEVAADFANYPQTAPFELQLIDILSFSAELKSDSEIPPLALLAIDILSFIAALKSDSEIPPLVLLAIDILSLGAEFKISAECPDSPLELVDSWYFGSFFESSSNASCQLVGGSDTEGLSFGELLDAELALWGISNRCSAPVSTITRAINDINGALQLVWNNAEGRNYWSKATLEVTVAAGQSSQNLPDTIQNVVGPCRRADNRRPLAVIGTIGELETFADIYLDGATAAEPAAYHVARSEQTGADGAKCVFHVTPAVVGAPVTFLLDVTHEAPRFSKYDLDYNPQIALPHAYAETLLLPIIFYKASCYHLFRSADQKPTIDREYQQAMISLGQADPLPGSAGDNSGKGGRAVAA